MRLVGLLVPIVFFAGCAGPHTLYSWGHYEDSIYQSYAKPGEMPPERQVELLEADYQKARSENKAVPPGWHAHLGYLYFQLGKLDQSRQEFMTEKTTFPESAVFMDRLLAKFEKPQ
jgi:hypothetical protein